MSKQIWLEDQHVVVTVQRERRLHQPSLVPGNARNDAMDDTTVVQNGQRVGKVYGLNDGRLLGVSGRLIAIGLHHGRLVQVIVADEKHARLVSDDDQVQGRVVDAKRHRVIFVGRTRRGGR